MGSIYMQIFLNISFLAFTIDVKLWMAAYTSIEASFLNHLSVTHDVLNGAQRPFLFDHIYAGQLSTLFFFKFWNICRFFFLSFISIVWLIKFWRKKNDDWIKFIVLKRVNAFKIYICMCWVLQPRGIFHS